ncbi:MAG TPA: hypothetical protein VGG16_02770 [Streptosporangiaceae bacterium]|jgi:hypothetical protein
MPDHPVSDRPGAGHPVGSLATFELRDLRRDLDDALTRTQADDPMRVVLQGKLRAVIAEQEERARVRRGRR